MLNIPMHSQLGGEDDGEFSVKILYVVVEGAPFKHKGSFFIWNDLGLRTALRTNRYKKHSDATTY